MYMICNLIIPVETVQSFNSTGDYFVSVSTEGTWSTTHQDHFFGGIVCGSCVRGEK